MKIFVTGASGFVGSSFVRQALEKGHEVAGLIIPSERVPVNVPSTSKVTWLRGTLDRAPWPEIAAFAPEACLHTAWVTTPGIYFEAPENEFFRDTSLVFLRRVRELGARYIVSLGSSIEYRITSEPLSEERTPIEPSTLYARCKNDLRRALEEDAQACGFGLCWARLFYLFGPGEHPTKLCSSITLKLLRGERVVLKTPHSAKDYIYREDVASALLTIVEKQFRGVINVGTGKAVAVEDIARRLGKLLGRPELIEAMEPPAPDPFPFVVADNTRLRQLGWRQEYDLDRSLINIVAAVREAARATQP